MTTVALFGGSFNPPHVAHQMVALYVLETQPVDALWFVPVYTHVFGKDLAPYADRVAMSELAAAPLGPRVQVSRAEEELARRPGFAGSRTLDLIDHLQATHPGIAFRLVVGTDILAEAHKWYRWDEVVAKAPLLVIGRTGYALPPGSVATGVTMPEVSSTAIRAALRQGAVSSGELASLLPASVLRYIAARGVYSSPSSPPAP
jgi:nicotinate-nucleotide adenylyltransferase